MSILFYMNAEQCFSYLLIGLYTLTLALVIRSKKEISYRTQVLHLGPLQCNVLAGHYLTTFRQQLNAFPQRID